MNIIPIEIYDKYIDEKFSVDEKKEIHDLFINFNKLRSKGEFKEIEKKLQEACKQGDFDLIKIYLNETINDDSRDLMYKIDETTKTASLFKVSTYIKKIIVPRTIQHKSTEYLITSITGTDSDIKSIKFVENSSVNTIYSSAISYSKVEEIYIPASLSELKEGWCDGTDNLKKIIISPSNGQFIFKENKYLLGKTDPNNDEFDNLLFVSRNIKEISISSNIKIISSFAFDACQSLAKIEIPQNSNLQIIGSYAFSRSIIEEIFIPPKVFKICECAFHNSFYLKKVEIPPNSNLQTIGSYAFSFSKINEIFIPPKVTEICECAFYFCKCLRNIEIPPNSNLRTIGSYAFSWSGIEEIFIPSKVTRICENAFYYCQYLRKVEIPQNSNLQIIESNAFSYSKIEEIYFPASLSELKEGWCDGTNNLKKIIISPSNGQFIMKENKYLLGKTDPNNDEFDNLLFVPRNIKEISIPSNIKIISSFAFSNCKNLTKVENSTKF